ncbi:transcriptional repressor LexA [Algiphilus sp.]|uniref:transcriptional repressor LexA n=1 Tax=Algiphilus sp. TaxID=1872431 RepID=UPI0032EDAB07
MLTARQQQILSFIQQRIVEEGAPPTRADIVRAFGFRSPNAAEAHLRALASKGAITLTPGAARGIRLTEPMGVPLIGKVAAGAPLLAVEHVERHVPLDIKLFSPAPDYLLRVQGESMRDAGILDGDLLAVHGTRDVFNGQIVVARIDDEVTVKRFRRRDHCIELHPENPDFPVISIDQRKGDLVIEGLAVGVVRRLTEGDG